MESSIQELIEAMKEQTQAINQLAASNMALVDLISQQMTEMDELPTATYLDGTQVRK